MKEHWIQKAKIKKGALHQQLGIPEGEKIPESTLEAKAHEPGLLGKRARLALAFRSMKHSKKRKKS